MTTLIYIVVSFHLFRNFAALVKESVGTGNGIVVFISYTWPNSWSIHFAKKWDLNFIPASSAVKHTSIFYVVL